MKKLAFFLAIALAGVTLYGAAVTPLAWAEAQRRIIRAAAANPAVQALVFQAAREREERILEAAIPASALLPPPAAVPLPLKKPQPTKGN